MLRAWNSIAIVPAGEQGEPAAFYLTPDKASLQRSAKGRKEGRLGHRGTTPAKAFVRKYFAWPAKLHLCSSKLAVNANGKRPVTVWQCDSFYEINLLIQALNIQLKSYVGSPYVSFSKSMPYLKSQKQITEKKKHKTATRHFYQSKGNCGNTKKIQKEVSVV